MFNQTGKEKRKEKVVTHWNHFIDNYDDRFFWAGSNQAKPFIMVYNTIHNDHFTDGSTYPM